MSEIETVTPETPAEQPANTNTGKNGKPKKSAKREALEWVLTIVAALAIAFVTPPVAMNLFVGSSMTGIGIDKITKAEIPHLLGLIVAFFVVAFVPAISLLLIGQA